ncbi:integrase core domain-containing protein, partial [Shewanella frigidimarina]|uniref:integrase core domain-containing protein n=1 Tax=Shewanella frigidimarina TaxID=56812 RepID=UPI003D7AA0EA
VKASRYIIYSPKREYKITAKPRRQTDCVSISAVQKTFTISPWIQYCSAEYQHKLAANAIRPSMTDGYDCYQNALAERVNGILKQEFLLYRCRTMKELAILIKESIRTYNELRPHLSLGMKTPNEVHEKASREFQLA